MCLAKRHCPSIKITSKVNSTGLHPRVHVDTAKVTAVVQAGGVLLIETFRAAGLDRGLSDARTGWQRPLSVHDPLQDSAQPGEALELGGEALSDVAVFRSDPGV